MSQRNKKANLRRPEEKEEVPAVVSNWSELCPDSLRCVFNRLNCIDLNQAKSVCSSWHSASRGCVPKKNQIPWLILFPDNEEDNNSSSCVLFAPDVRDKVYKTRDLGFEFVYSSCLATYGSWLLMLNHCDNLYILNPLTSERVDLSKTMYLPKTKTPILKACFWIDNKTKEYLVFKTTFHGTMFTKKGVNNKPQEFLWFERPYEEIVYVHKNRKLYLYDHESPIKIWDFSGNKPREGGFLSTYGLRRNKFPLWKNNRDIAVTVSGDVLIVTLLEWCKRWHFHIYKENNVKREWEEIDSLGDEALILDMGVTVVARDVPGIKRNSIYFSGIGYERDDPDNIFVFDLTTKKMEPLPQCVFSSIQYFYHAQWFFPCFSG